MTRLHDAEIFRAASVDAVFNKAREVCDEEEAKSKLFNQLALDEIPRFARNEIVLGRVAGRGGFCVVREITSVKLNGMERKKRGFRSRTDSTTSSTKSCDSLSSPGGNPVGPPDISTREYLARRVWSKGNKYVLKEVEPTLLESDKVTYLRGLVDLALEASFLTSLSHPNLLGLRGVAKNDPFSGPGYFLILDQLNETLPKRLNSWMQVKRTTSGITGFVTRGKRKAASLMIERLLVAYDTAEAMWYLHSNNVIYRDLKPDNIGFNGEGSLKIFDFGLAKELREEEMTENNLYLMTGFTGGIRFMAPEVGLYEPYNQSADVYSWSMLLWYILALEPPMGMYTPQMFIERVFKKGYRPAIKEKWPQGLRDLMKGCWSRELSDRPTFKTILKTLRQEATNIDPELGDFFAGDLASRTSSSFRSSLGLTSCYS